MDLEYTKNIGPDLLIKVWKSLFQKNIMDRILYYSQRKVAVSVDQLLKRSWSSALFDSSSSSLLFLTSAACLIYETCWPTCFVACAFFFIVIVLVFYYYYYYTMGG